MLENAPCYDRGRMKASFAKARTAGQTEPLPGEEAVCCLPQKGRAVKIVPLPLRFCYALGLLLQCAGNNRVAVRFHCHDFPVRVDDQQRKVDSRQSLRRDLSRPGAI